MNEEQPHLIRYRNPGEAFLRIFHIDKVRKEGRCTNVY